MRDEQFIFIATNVTLQDFITTAKAKAYQQFLKFLRDRKKFLLLFASEIKRFEETSKEKKTIPRFKKQIGKDKDQSFKNPPADQKKFRD